MIGNAVRLNHAAVTRSRWGSFAASAQIMPTVRSSPLSMRSSVTEHAPNLQGNMRRSLTRGLDLLAGQT